MQELTVEWVAKAENDFTAANLLLHAGEFPVADATCFHSQQCAEKYLKAFLQEHQVRFERSHSLMLLLDLCLPLDGDFEQLRDHLLQLDNFSVAVRYPGVPVTVEMASRAHQTVGEVRGFMRQKLNIK